jgi:PAS domain S-box-containing protein
MIELIKKFFSADGFMPHGHCYLWNSGVLSLHIISDALIALAYFSIPFTLLYFVRKRKDLEFHWMFVCFAVFIIACGMTHVMEIWVIWHPTYWLSGGIKAVTALASVPTAILLVKLIPDALDLPSPSVLRKTNLELKQEISERTRAETEVRRLNTELESHVAERTRELRDSENRLRSVLDATPSAVVVMRADGKILDWNGRAERVFGWSRAEIIGKDMAETLIPPRYREAHRRGLARFISNGNPPAPNGVMEMSALRRDGMEFPVEMSISRLGAADELTFCGFIMDVSERKRMEETRERLAAIVESSDDAILSATLDGIITSWNPAAEKLYGYSALEIVGKPLMMFVPPERSGEEQKILETVGRGESILRFESKRLKKDGRSVVVSITASPIRDSNGKIVGISKIARDITERKQSDDRLRNSLKEVNDLKSALDEHAIVAITDPHGRITYVNDKFCKISKYSREELLGKDHRIINSEFHPKEFIRDLWETIASGRVWKGEIRNRAKDGSIYWVDTTIVPFLDSDGKPYQYVAIRNDITERKFAEQEIRKLNEGLTQRIHERTAELEAANKELEAFCYSVSHDLRAPLRHIDGFVALLQRDSQSGLSEKSRHFMSQISDSAKQMGRLIDDLLVFSRTSRAGINHSRINLDALFDETIRRLGPETEGRNIVWKKTPLPEVFADEPMLRQVVVNLLSNAVKYTRPRDPAVIEIGSMDEPDQTVIFVRDNGVGFDMAYGDKLFGVFQRLHSDDQFEGSGIGLASIRRIISRHGGRTWAEGKLNAGATFYFSLPKIKPSNS